MQLGAGTSLFCLSQCAIPFCTLSACGQTMRGAARIEEEFSRRAKEKGRGALQ